MNIEHDYLKLLKDILDNGREKGDRTGTGTVSVFGRQIRHDMSKGFPLLTTKKMYWKGIVTELLWFLRGDTHIQFLHDNDCHIWDGDYEKSGRKDGDLGPIYGKQWRDWSVVGIDIQNTSEDGKSWSGECWNEKGIDQIQNSINLLKTDPDSRRNIVSAWNVGELDKMTLPPCHNFFQFYTRELSLDERIEISTFWHKDEVRKQLEDSTTGTTEKYVLDKLEKQGIPTRAISLMFNMRSNDVPLGLPFNIASYALLLEIFGKMVNMIPDELIVNIGDGHIYKNQIDGVKEQITREAYPLPKLVISDDVNFTSTIDEFLNSCSISDFKIEDYKSHPTIKMPLSN